jgi:hypothetical protein
MSTQWLRRLHSSLTGTLKSRAQIRHAARQIVEALEARQLLSTAPTADNQFAYVWNHLSSVARNDLARSWNIGTRRRRRSSTRICRRWA